MRVTHNLWKVSNGWLLVPEGCDSVLSSNDAPQAAVFKSLKEFSEWKPARVRRKRSKPSTTKESNNANIT
jgi:hypothetical protein